MKKNCANLALCIFPTAGVPVQYCEQPTNGISYFRAISSITDIPEEFREYLPLFCYILTKYDVISFAAVLSFVLKASNFAVALVFHQLHVFFVKFRLGHLIVLSFVIGWKIRATLSTNQTNAFSRAFHRLHVFVSFVISQSNYFVFLYRETLKITQRTLKFARGSCEKWGVEPTKWCEK